MELIAKVAGGALVRDLVFLAPNAAIDRRKRVPIAQTEEFYVALKTRGVDTVMVRFPNEPHGIRGAHPSHWVAKVEYILGWFEQHGASARP